MKKILIVEPAEAIADAISVILKYEGYDIWIVQRFQEALSHTVAIRPHLVIVNILDRRLDMQEFIKELYHNIFYPEYRFYLPVHTFVNSPLKCIFHQ